MTDLTPAFETAIMGLRAKQCRWPHGHPNEAGFRFCDADKRKSGGSYCEVHYRRSIKLYESKDETTSTLKEGRDAI